MNHGLLATATLAAAAIALWGFSFFVERARRVPEPPKTLPWAPGIPIHYVDVRGCRVRFVKTGQGPNLLLLHPLRTQLDLFEKVLPELGSVFTVYAVDYPGHGYSDIPRARYDAKFFADFVEAFLEAVDLQDLTLSGVSIGASVSLILAGRRNPRIARVVAVNPYDYAKGRGLARSSVVGRLIMAAADLPVVGETFMRLRTFALVKPVLLGGVANSKSIPPALMRELYAAGNRRDHYRAFVSLLHHAASWERATDLYARIVVPVRVVWGEQDWSRLEERERDRRLIPKGEVVTVTGGGHFLPLDRPDAVIEEIETFAGVGCTGHRDPVP
ncbi:MAG: hypothetical protein DMD82_02560 [Candidatus Rokuibacteriota bacterium]|nr:MAG: hypothetical protein DMD82_02560 [Candidatus Rokubacteria bacterium]